MPARAKHTCIRASGARARLGGEEKCVGCDLTSKSKWMTSSTRSLTKTFYAPYMVLSVALSLQQRKDVFILPFAGFRRRFPSFSRSLRLCHLRREVPVGSYFKAMEQVNNIQVVPCTNSNYLRPFRVQYNQVSRYSLLVIICQWCGHTSSFRCQQPNPHSFCHCFHRTSLRLTFQNELNMLTVAQNDVFQRQLRWNRVFWF